MSSINNVIEDLLNKSLLDVYFLDSSEDIIDIMKNQIIFYSKVSDYDRNIHIYNLITLNKSEEDPLLDF